MTMPRGASVCVNPKCRNQWHLGVCPHDPPPPGLPPSRVGGLYAPPGNEQPDGLILLPADTRAVPAERVPALADRVDRLNRRAARLFGIEPLKLETFNRRWVDGAEVGGEPGYLSRAQCAAVHGGGEAPFGPKARSC